MSAPEALVTEQEIYILPQDMAPFSAQGIAGIGRARSRMSRVRRDLHLLRSRR
jgi:hypothetical protein